MKKFFLIKLISFIIISTLIFFSLRIDLIYEKNIKILISFIIIQYVICSVFIYSKKNFYFVFLYNITFIVLLNLVLTPLFNLITFDVPIRQPNTKTILEYKSDFYKGIISGKHSISYDKKGYRTNKKVDYNNKNSNSLRIFTIGASNTEEQNLDDNKTWSSLLEKNLEKETKKNVEVINTGVSGLRAEHHYITLKRIKKYKPDLVIILLGINDWNNHIVNRDKNYLIPSYEIKYDFKKSILFNTFGNINKQIYGKFIKRRDENDDKKNILVNRAAEYETFLLPLIDSLNNKKIIKNFRIKNVSQEYQYWLSLMMRECKKKDLTCLFLDQPTAYKQNISNELKSRLWMTPPYQTYTLSLNDLIYTSFKYNNWLKNEILQNGLSFLKLSDNLEPNTTYFLDDCHFTENGSKQVSDDVTSYIMLNLKLLL